MSRTKSKTKNVCKWCGNSGHLEKGCKKKIQKPIFTKAVYDCRRCGERGHSEDECKNDYKSVCNKCGISGHEHWYCWK